MGMPECNFLNYMRNMACFHCDGKRPPEGFIENKVQEKQRDPRMRMEKIATRPQVSNAWNFDFDDDESDGADVAAFEYADSSIRAEETPLGHEDDFNRTSGVPRARERVYSDLDSNRSGTGFDDEDDEDDVDSYEIDGQTTHSVRKASPSNFAEVEVFSEAEDNGSEHNFPGYRRETFPSSSRQSEPTHGKSGFSVSEDDELDFDTDEELSVHPNWKSSHIADSRHGSRGRGPSGSSRRLSLGSDEEFGLNSDLDDDLDEDLRSRQAKGNKPVGRSFQRRVSSDMENDPFSGSESDTDELQFRRNRCNGKKIQACRRGNNFEGHGDYKFVRDTQFRSNGKMSDRRRNSANGGFNKPARGSSGGNRGSWEDGSDAWRMNDRGRHSRNFGGPKREGYGQRGRSSYKSDHCDSGEFRNSRRSIER